MEYDSRGIWWSEGSGFMVMINMFHYIKAQSHLLPLTQPPMMPLLTPESWWDRHVQIRVSPITKFIQQQQRHNSPHHHGNMRRKYPMYILRRELSLDTSPSLGLINFIGNTRTDFSSWWKRYNEMIEIWVCHSTYAMALFASGE